MAVKPFIRNHLPGYQALYRLRQLSPLVSLCLQRPGLAWKMYRATRSIPTAHTHEEAIAVIKSILDLPPTVPGIVVEAGCFKGSSTAKFSLATKITGRQLIVFDSFQGLPDGENDTRFSRGMYSGGLEEVWANVARYGHVQSCRFIPGWFEDSMPSFREPIAIAYIDCDLESSTKTCLKYLWPLIVPGGVVYSQDGHVQKVVNVFEEHGLEYERLGRRLLRVVKH